MLKVKTAFFHGDLHKEVYINPPLGLHHHPQHVCRLYRAIYGLKQAFCAWFENFIFVVLTSGSIQSVHDHAMFIHLSPRGLTILLYVNDMIITRDDLVYIQPVKAILQQ